VIFTKSKEWLLENWVSVPVSIRTPSLFSPIFKVGSRTLFVDFPNSLYIAFLHNTGIEISRITEKFEEGSVDTVIEELIGRIKSLAKDFNSILQSKGIDWFKIVVRKMPPHGKASYLITYCYRSG